MSQISIPVDPKEIGKAFVTDIRAFAELVNALAEDEEYWVLTDFCMRSFREELSEPGAALLRKLLDGGETSP